MSNVSSSAKTPAFIDLQYAFTRHIRDPEQNPRPADIEDRRMQIYRELFYNNVEDFIASSFPVLRSITADDAWHAMIRDYFSRHKAKSPLFPEMPREFLQYLESERGEIAEDPPFLLELAHYEWVELALSISEQDIVDNDIDADADLLTGIPVLSPLAWPLQYHYPVHQISPDYIPQHTGETPTSIIVYRDLDDEVAFLEVNPVTAALISMIASNDESSGKDLLLKLGQELQHPEPEILIQAGAEILTGLRQRHIILGCR